MDVARHLPPHLHGATITKVAAGLSGAAVFRVEKDGQCFVLKIAAAHEDAASWKHALELQRVAGEAGLAPRVVHVDVDGRAVTSEWVDEQPFARFYRDPATHETALHALGAIVRRIHALPLPDAPPRDARMALAEVWTGPLAGFAVPAWVRACIERALAAPAPRSERVVTSHNDMNPSNIVWTGERIVVLDWAAVAPNSETYDLATLALFLRMDDAAVSALLDAYGPVSRARFDYDWNLVSALAGAYALFRARNLGHPGATTGEALPLGDFYARMHAGALKLGTADGQWHFGLALLAARAST